MQRISGANAIPAACTARSSAAAITPAQRAANAGLQHSAVDLTRWPLMARKNGGPRPKGLNSTFPWPSTDIRQDARDRNRRIRRQIPNQICHVVSTLGVNASTGRKKRTRGFMRLGITYLNRNESATSCNRHFRLDPRAGTFAVLARSFPAGSELISTPERISDSDPGAGETPQTPRWPVWTPEPGFQPSPAGRGAISACALRGGPGPWRGEAQMIGGHGNAASRSQVASGRSSQI